MLQLIDQESGLLKAVKIFRIEVDLFMFLSQGNKKAFQSILPGMFRLCFNVLYSEIRFQGTPLFQLLSITIFNSHGKSVSGKEREFLCRLIPAQAL